MADAALLRLLQQRNKAGDLDAIPVPQEDNRPFLKRLGDMLASGGWHDPQPGQRGTFVPGTVGDDGKVSAAVPGIIQQPAEGFYGMMTAPLSDIVRSGDRDAIRAASEASFDVASMLPAAGVAARRMRPRGNAQERALEPATAPPREYSTGPEQIVPDYSYGRVPFQEDWPNQTPYGRTARPYHGQDMAFTDPRGIHLAEAGAPGARVLKYQDMTTRMKTAGQDPVPGVRGMDGRPVYSNPDDPNTAAILALLTQQEKPSAGLAGAKPGTGAGAGRLAGAPEPTGQPSGRPASGLPGLAPDASPGQPAQGPRATIENDPHLKAWADQLGLNYDGELSPAIARAAAETPFESLGIRVTPYEMERGSVAPESKQWYQDFGTYILDGTRWHRVQSPSVTGR